MNNITVVIITKNEEKMIRDCIKSVSQADKILVIDSGSTDKTMDIAVKHNARVISHSFINFSETRNYALQQVKTDWILYLDADERVSKELWQEIRSYIKNTKYSAYSLLRKNYYFGKEWPYKEKLTRLFYRKNLLKWYGDLHESPQFTGNLGESSNFLLHYTHRSIEEMINKTIIWSEVEAKLRLDVNHPKVTWWRLIRVFLTGFINSYLWQRGFLVGIYGFIESYYQGFSMFITYVRLWEMQQKE